MEEHTLLLAKHIAKQSLEDEEEARDGSPRPLRKNHANRLIEAKIQGFRFEFLIQIF